MKRKSVKRGKSRRVFRNTSGFHKKNLTKGSFRGGIRL